MTQQAPLASRGVSRLNIQEHERDPIRIEDVEEADELLHRAPEAGELEDDDGGVIVSLGDELLERGSGVARS